MAVSTDEYNALLARITKLERSINDVFVALNQLVSQQQVNGLFTVLQQDHAALETRVDAVETRMDVLENEPYDEV